MNWNFLKKPWPAVIWTIIIFVLMTIPGNSIPSHGLFGIPHLDKLVHAIMFGALVLLWSRWAIIKGSQLKASFLLFLAFLAAVGYGTGIKFLKILCSYEEL